MIAWSATSNKWGSEGFLPDGHDPSRSLPDNVCSRRRRLCPDAPAMYALTPQWLVEKIEAGQRPVTAGRVFTLDLILEAHRRGAPSWLT